MAEHAQRLAQDCTEDAVTGSFRLLQRRAGHRYSIDDMLTACVAAQHAPSARSVLDLGTGVSSVLLMLAYKLESAQLVGVEAQIESHALGSMNVERNGLGARASVVLGDLRDASLLARLRDERAPDGFELVTGTPPYLPASDGTLPPDAQRAHARFELRGGVEDYVRAAAAVLHPQGVLCVCAKPGRTASLDHTAREVGLERVRSLSLVPVPDKPVLFVVHTLRAIGEARAQEPVSERFVARDAFGARSAASRALRDFFDLPAPTRNSEQSSPKTRARRQQPSLSDTRA